MTWSTITLEITTPLFTAGHAPKTDEERVPSSDAQFRVSSLLGAMRFWFRALAAAHVGPDLRALHHWEGRVFGRAARGASGDGPAGARPDSSPVQWRVLNQPDVTDIDADHAWLPSRGMAAREQGADRWLVYLLGRDLGNLAGCTVRRPYIAPGQHVELQFRPRRDDPVALALQLAALWLTCTFGGVGARTRRGFGGLRVAGVDLASELPKPWNSLPLNSPPKPGVAQLDHLWCKQTEAFRRLMAGDQKAPEWTSAPEFPVLGPGPLPETAPGGTSARRLTRASLGSRHATWGEALADAGHAWRLFRAREPASGVRYRPEVKTSEWLNVVHGGDDYFELGALGMPIVFKDKYVAQVLVGAEKARRASPVWMRPVLVDDSWHVFSFAFLGKLLPDDPKVKAQLDKDKVFVKDILLPTEFTEGLADPWFDELHATRD